MAETAPGTPPLGVRATEASVAHIARVWAERVDCPMLEVASNSDGFVLEVSASDAPPGHCLSLRCPQALGGGLVRAEFVTGTLGYRQRVGGGRGQALARAVGLKGGFVPDVIDATAGLGRDAFVLASLGCRVTLYERSAVVAALVENGLQRAAGDARTSHIVARMHLERADARVALSAILSHHGAMPADVIYLDPMYPGRTKSALVKKEMRVLRALVGDNEDAPMLLELALQLARRRVVVKRPAHAPAVRGAVPTAQVASKSTRYDIYATTTACASQPV